MTRHRREITSIVRLARIFAGKPLVQVAFITLVVIFLSAFAVFYFEHLQTNSNIVSFWDGIWWTVVTMGTVGYGDKYPVTLGGQFVGIFLIFTGIGLMSLITATVASIFVERRMKEGKGLETVKVKDHIIICGWNQHTEEVLQGLTTYGTRHDAPIVLINELSVDEIEALRLKYNKYHLKFIRGNFVHEDVLIRSNISKAKFVMIMADQSTAQPQERTDERTTLTALTIKSMAPNVKIIVELLDAENRPHLKRANVDDVIVRGEHVGSLLASAINSPGLPKAISSIISLGDKNKLWRLNVPPEFIGRTFRELFDHFHEKEHAILMGFLKEKKTMKLEDILSDNTSIIDNFIREKLREAKRDFAVDRDAVRVLINPDDDYVITAEDQAIVLSKIMPVR
ncbi:MAG: NAD-binding protein [Syntrophales bacterium]|nr:NAD-binding protein [Syntrophales bacterium]